MHPCSNACFFSILNCILTHFRNNNGKDKDVRVSFNSLSHPYSMCTFHHYLLSGFIIFTSNYCWCVLIPIFFIGFLLLSREWEESICQCQTCSTEFWSGQTLN